MGLQPVPTRLERGCSLARQDVSLQIVRSDQSSGRPEIQNLFAVVCGRCKTTLDLSGAPQDVNGTALAQVLRCSPIPVLVDFWAPWCQPSRASGPIVDEVARDHAGKLIVLLLNTEQEPAPAIVHGVKSLLTAQGFGGIPTLILFRRGQEVARRSGVLPSTQLSQWLDSARERPSAVSASPL